MPATRKVPTKQPRTRNGGSEPAFRKKCISLVRRTNEVYLHNKTLLSHIKRSKRRIQRIELEQAFLMEKIEKIVALTNDGSEGDYSLELGADPDILVAISNSPSNPFKLLCVTEGLKIRRQHSQETRFKTAEVVDQAWSDLRIEGTAAVSRGTSKAPKQASQTGD